MPYLTRFVDLKIDFAIYMVDHAREPPPPVVVVVVVVWHVLKIPHF